MFAKVGIISVGRSRLSKDYVYTTAELAFLKKLALQNSDDEEAMVYVAVLTDFLRSVLHALKIRGLASNFRTVSPVSREALETHAPCRRMKHLHFYEYVKSDIVGLLENEPKLSKESKLWHLYLESMEIVSSCEAFLNDNPYVQTPADDWFAQSTSNEYKLKG